MDYTITQTLPKEEKSAIKFLLVPPKNKNMVIEDLPKELAIFKFNNNWKIAIMMDGPEFVPGKDNSPWIYAVLLDEENTEVKQGEIVTNTTSIKGEWTIEYDSDTYTVNIE